MILMVSPVRSYRSDLGCWAVNNIYWFSDNASDQSNRLMKGQLCELLSKWSSTYWYKSVDAACSATFSAACSAALKAAPFAALPRQPAWLDASVVNTNF